MYWLLAHFIGDFIIQTDWMARNKKTNHVACWVHSITYIIPFLPLMALGFTSWWQLALVASQHSLQDGTDFVLWFMKKTGSEGFTKAPMAPWSVIIVDNILHISFMALVFSL